MPPCIVDRPGGTGDYLFMFFYDEIVIGTGGMKKTCPPNSLMIWDKGAGHYYGNKDISWLHSWIHCDGKLIARLMKSGNFTFGRPILNINPAKIEKYLLDLHNELHEESPDPEIAKNLLRSLFREISRMASCRSRQRIPDNIAKVRWKLETSFRERTTLRGLAKEAGMSVPHLCAQFKKHFGVPPVEYLISLRMKHASYFLSDMNLRITEVAAKAGYGDIFYFSRLFKKRMGVSPVAFRKKLL